MSSVSLFRFHYINHRGKIELRSVLPRGFYYGTREPFFTEPQWLFDAFDSESGEEKTFALAKMQGVKFAHQFLVTTDIDFWTRVKEELIILIRNGRPRSPKNLIDTISAIIREKRKQIPFQPPTDAFIASLPDFEEFPPSSLSPTKEKEETKEKEK